MAVVATLVVGWVVLSARAQRLWITSPMVFVAGGLLLGGDKALRINLNAATVRGVAEITLVLLLFADASRVELRSLRRDIGLPLRLLGIGLPLTVAAGALLAYGFFGGLGFWMALLIGACLAPTDAGLGAGIVTDQRVPSLVRRVLNVESGLNDGIVAPVVYLAIAVVAGE